MPSVCKVDTVSIGVTSGEAAATSWTAHWRGGVKSGKSNSLLRHLVDMGRLNDGFWVVALEISVTQIITHD